MGRQSAARLQGDRYQHLFSWFLILELLNPDSKIQYILLEDADAYSVDDVTVHSLNPSENPSKYYQIKWHLDRHVSYSMDSLIKRKKTSPSLLEKLWHSWNNLKGRGATEIVLVSNAGIKPGDPLADLIDTYTERLKGELIKGRARPATNISVEKWQVHLKANNAEFIEFCGTLRFQLSFGSIAKLNSQVDERMRAFGLKFGDEARSIAIEQVRNWIEERAKNKITITELEHVITKYNLRLPSTDEKAISIAIFNWSKRKLKEDFEYKLDWSHLFDHPTRRVPDAKMWAQTLIPELRDLERKVASENSEKLIHLQGDLCLSSAFAIGHVFSAAAGYHFQIHHKNEIWYSDVKPEESFELNYSFEETSKRGKDLLLIVDVTGSAKEGILRYTSKVKVNSRVCLFVTPKVGTNDQSIKGNVEAVSFARSLRHKIREVNEMFTPNTTHMFYDCATLFL